MLRFFLSFFFYSYANHSVRSAAAAASSWFLVERRMRIVEMGGAQLLKSCSTCKEVLKMTTPGKRIWKLCPLTARVFWFFRRDVMGSIYIFEYSTYGNIHKCSWQHNCCQELLELGISVLKLQMKLSELYTMQGQSRWLSLSQIPLMKQKMRNVRLACWRDSRIWDMIIRLK